MTAAEVVEDREQTAKHQAEACESPPDVGVALDAEENTADQ